MSKSTSTKKKSKISSSKKSNSTNFKSLFSLITDGRLKKIVGLLLLLLSIFLIVSLFSYLFTWQQDQDKVIDADVFHFLFKEKDQIFNKAGRLGALISHQIIFNGFGIASFLFIMFFGMWGLNLLLHQRISSTLKSFFYTSFFILFLSPIFAFLFSNEKFQFAYGGALGHKIISFLDSVAGEMGTLFIIIGLIIVVLIIAFNPIFKLPIWHQFANKQNEVETLQDDSNTIVANVASVSNQPLAETEFPIHVAEINKEEPVIVPDSFWDIDENSIPLTKSNSNIELENIAPPVIENKQDDVVDLTMEIVQKEEDHSHIKNDHISIGTDEPYDPALELRNYKFPTIDLLEQRSVEEISIDKNELEVNKNQIINTLKSFGISIAKISATVGPTVTLYEIVPSEGVRISKIRNLEDDIALSLSALGIRIIAPIPGKGTIGIEVPNLKKQIVSMRTLISSDKFIKNEYSLPIALGKKIDNENYIVDLATMPHLLMAGATGQGKSVGINTILVSLLYKKHPSQLKFVLVDPKKVELSIYKVIEKHFLAKLPNEDEAIITDTKKVINTLNALCIEMDNRYDLLKEAGVRNIKEYNDKFIKRRLNPNKGHIYLPFIVLVVDEFADLIMTAGKEVEMPIARLAQLARAVGIHLIIATQRPSVNVITGTIKANFPGRMAFRVSAKVDSRTILDTGGADQLVGRGDMLILNGNDLVRVQCAFVDTPEVERIVDFIGSQQGYPSAFDLPEYEGSDGGDLGAASTKSLKEVDQMFEQCARLIVTSGTGSTSMLQRRFQLGYNRAARIMDQMEAVGIVGASSGGKVRELMVHTESELDEILRTIGV
jgi:DNA segregation ATPase FtsK/SpoIIIE, S-DNA-T family